MSNSQAGINVVDQILQEVDLAGIQDERARECIRVLLNLIESLTAELRKAHAENLYLREHSTAARVEGANRTGPKTVRHRHHSHRKKSERSLRKPNSTASAANWSGFG
jgi:hypothetical protein